MRVVVQGRLKSRSYETREGEKRTVFEIDVDEVGPSLRNATAKVTKTTRSGGSGGGFGGNQGGGYGGNQDNDPWASQPAGQGGGFGGPQGGNDPWANQGSGAPDEPPF